MDTAADRLRQARISAGFEQAAEAAERFGWNQNTYRANENGNASFSFKKAKEYAKAYKVRPEWLYDASGQATLTEAASSPLKVFVAGDPVDIAAYRAFVAQPPVEPAAQVRIRKIGRRIPVVGEVAAGVWLEAHHRQVEETDEFLPMDVLGYERAQLTAMRVVGRSMDLVYPPGRYVVIAHPAEAGLRSGDYVVVERAKGDFVEITLKELVDEGGRLALYPRSSDPDYQTPFYLKARDEAEQTGVTIIGVVVADYAKRERPPISMETYR